MATSAPYLDLNYFDACGELVDWIRWLLGSGIQSSQGYFYDWHDLAYGRFGLPYPEVTGYGVSTLCWLYERTRNEELLERARHAFLWLDTVALDPHWSLVGARGEDRNGTRSNDQYLYSFDSGIVAAGLVRLSERSPDKRIRYALARISASFCHNLFRPNNTIWPLVDMGTEAPTSIDNKWSHRFSGYQLKALTFLTMLHSKRRAQELPQQQAKTVIEIFENVLGYQQRCGAFPAMKNGETHLHPHLYTLEGLVVAAYAYQQPAWLEPVSKGYVYLEQFFAKNGNLPTQALEERITVPYERVDILSQFLRMGSYLVSVGCLDRASLSKTLAKARERLSTYQIPDGTQQGGYLFGQDFEGTIKHHVNACASFVAAQALWWFELAMAGWSIDPTELV